MLDIIGKRYWFFAISGIIILAGIIALVAFGLQPGVEFTSGYEVTLNFENKAVSKNDINRALADLGFDSAIVRKAGADFIVDLPEMTGEKQQAVISGLSQALGPVYSGDFLQVPRADALNTTRNAAIAVLIAAIGMLLYISWAFHRMPNPIRWGTCAIISLLHDLLVVIGVFALLGGIFGWQVDLMFVAGVLTVIGYSVNDSIVIFDRIRENIKRNPGVDFERVVNMSLVEAISRTFITGIGTIFVLIALLLLVGDPIQNLVAVLLVGVIVGTYSGMCTAAPLLVVWNKGEWGRFIGRKPVITR